MDCPACKTAMVGVEYGYGSPERYDGVSEWACFKCGKRIGRWSGKELKPGKIEPRYGKQHKGKNSKTAH